MRKTTITLALPLYAHGKNDYITLGLHAPFSDRVKVNYPVDRGAALRCVLVVSVLF